MATVLDIIKSAMELIRVLPAGEVPSGEDSDYCLKKYNSMLDTFSAEIEPIYDFVIDQKALTEGDGEYTIGSGGDIDTTRPAKIDVAGSFIRDSNGNDTTFDKELTEREYNQIADKTPGNSTPNQIFFKPEYPLGKIYLYPPPSSGLTLHLLSSKPITEIADVGDSFSYPPGYKEMHEYQLALRIAPGFRKVPDPEVVITARRLYNEVANRNHAKRLTRQDLNIPVGNRTHFNLFTGN